MAFEAMIDDGTSTPEQSKWFRSYLLESSATLDVERRGTCEQRVELVALSLSPMRIDETW